ncbi:hypothetical protein [Thalassospira alkalitolerans]
MTGSLNPLDAGDDTPKNRERVYAILKSLAGIDLKMRISTF